MATAAELRERLSAECERIGGVRAFARATGASASVVSAVRSGARPMEPAIANALGYVVVTQYRRCR